MLSAAWLGALALAAFGLVLEPDPRGWGTHEQLGLLPCLPMFLWNIPCPGCGVTTAVVLALHGDLVGSLGTQPFGFFLALALPSAAAYAAVAHFRGRDLWQDVRRLRFSWAVVLSLALLAWLYKLIEVRGWFGAS